MFSRRLSCLGLILLLAAAPIGELSAQQPESRTSGARRWIFAAVGAALLAAPVALFVKERTEEDKAFCSSIPCQTGLAAAMGGLAGYLLGADRDRAAARERALGPVLPVNRRVIELEVVPERLLPYPGGALVVGRQGLATIGADGAVTRFGGGLRRVGDAAVLEELGTLLALTQAGVLAFALAREGGGQLVFEETGISLEPVGAEHVVLGSGADLRRFRVTGRQASVRFEDEQSVSAGAPVSWLAFAPSAGVLWTVAGTRVSARSGEDLGEIGSADLPENGRSIVVSGGTAIVVAGGAGAFVLDVSRPEAPAVVGRIGGVPYAFDAALLGSTAYIAGGRSGLMAYDLTDPAAPRLLGSARELGMVTAVTPAGAGQLLVIDRSTGRVHIVEPAVVQTGSSDGRSGSPE